MTHRAAQSHDAGDLSVPGQLRGDDIVGSHRKADARTQRKTTMEIKRFIQSNRRPVGAVKSRTSKGRAFI